MPKKSKKLSKSKVQKLKVNGLAARSVAGESLTAKHFGPLTLDPRTPAAIPNVAKPPDLTAEEAAELKSCEETIERGLETFVAVGKALLAIRDRRLRAI